MTVRNREERPLGPPPGFEEVREVRAVAYPRDGQLDRPDPGVPAPVAIPVALELWFPDTLLHPSGHPLPKVAPPSDSHYARPTIRIVGLEELVERLAA